VSAQPALVSILTPSYNQARWLGDNLRSVASQTYPQIEHVVMDGGSTDGSVGLLESIAGPAVWRSEADEGQSDALNKAFAAATGDVIGWLNSDDAYFDTAVVADVVGFFEAHPDVDIVYGHTAYVNAAGLILHMMWVPPFSKWLLRSYDFIVQPAVFMRRSALKMPLVDTSYQFAMDYELWLRLSRDRRFARIDRVLAIDRVQAGRKSLGSLDVFASDIARLRERYGVAMTRSWSRALQSVIHVLSRMLGMRLICATQAELAFTSSPIRASRLLWRQIAGRRSRMPVEGVEP